MFTYIRLSFLVHKITIQHLRTDFCMLNLDKILFNYPEGAKLLFMQKLNLWKNGEVTIIQYQTLYFYFVIY